MFQDELGISPAYAADLANGFATIMSSIANIMKSIDLVKNDLIKFKDLGDQVVMVLDDDFVDYLHEVSYETVELGKLNDMGDLLELVTLFDESVTEYGDVLPNEEIVKSNVENESIKRIIKRYAHQQTCER